MDLFFLLYRSNRMIRANLIVKEERVFKMQCYCGPIPNVSTSEQISQTRAGLEIPYLIIGISLSEHLLHKSRPQCRQ